MNQRFSVLCLMLAIIQNMITLMNLDDFIKIGGSYKPVRIKKAHFYGYECEYRLFLGDRVADAIVILYRFGGRYICPGRSSEADVPFFKSISREILAQYGQYSMDDLKREYRRIYAIFACQLAGIVFKYIIPAYQIINILLGTHMPGENHIRGGICLLSFFAAIMIYMIKIHLYGLNAAPNSDIEAMKTD